MKPWLRNKQQANTQQDNSGERRASLQQVIELLRKENQKGYVLRMKGGECLFQKMEELDERLKALDKIKPYEKVHIEEEDNIAAFMSFLINGYINIGGERLSQEFVQKIMQTKMNISWKSSRYFSIIEESGDVVVFENGVMNDSYCDFGTIKVQPKTNQNAGISTKSEEIIMKLKNGADLIVPITSKIDTADIEIHQLESTNISTDFTCSRQYLLLDSKNSQQKLQLHLMYFNDNKVVSNSTLSRFLYHIHLYNTYPTCFGSIRNEIALIQPKDSSNKSAVFIVNKPICSLQDIIRERSLEGQHFTQGQLKDIFVHLTDILLDVLHKKEIVYVTEMTAANIGYSKKLKQAKKEDEIQGQAEKAKQEDKLLSPPENSTETVSNKDKDVVSYEEHYYLSSLNLLTSRKNFFLSKKDFLPRNFQEILENNYPPEFDALKVGMHSLAGTLLQVYNLREARYSSSELEEIAQQIKKEEIQVDDFLKVVLYLIKGEEVSVQENMKILVSREQIEQGEQTVSHGDADIAKKVVEKQKNKLKKQKKKQRDNSSFMKVQDIADGYLAIEDKKKALEVYQSFIVSSKEEKDGKMTENNQKEMICAMQEMAVIQISSGELKEAEQSLREAAQIAVQYQLTEQLKEISHEWHSLGKQLNQKGLMKEHIQIQKEILELLERNLSDPQDLAISASLYSLGEAYKSVGDFAKALPLIKRAQDIDLKAHGSESLQAAVALHELGTIELQKGNFQEAINNFEKSLSIKRKHLSSNDLDIVKGINNEAEAYRGMGNNPKALELFQNALTILENIHQSDSQEASPILNNIGIIFYQQGEHSKGIEFLEKALQIEKRILGEDHPTNAQTMFNLMIMLQKINKIEQAIEYGQTAYRIFLNIMPQGHPTLIQCQQVLNFLSSKVKNQ